MYTLYAFNNTVNIIARKGIGTLGTMVTRLLIQAIAIRTLTNPLGVSGMKARILIGVPGILEIKILIGERKVKIIILDLMMLIKTPLGEAITIGTQQMPQAMMVQMKVQMKILME